jgi:thiazole synthase ThiGH ThiG subunit
LRLEKKLGYPELEMPTILRQDGFDVMIYTDDHPPAHSHVWKAGGELVVNLGDDDTPPSIRSGNGRMSPRDARRAVIIVEDNQQVLLVR